MRGLFQILLMLTMTLTGVSCNRTIKPEELPPSIQLGGEYYTQFVIRYEKGTHMTTNYRRGAAIPVNTKVKLLKMTEKTIEVEVLPNRMQLTIKNAIKHTNDDTFQAFAKLFNKKPVDLSVFTPFERQHIHDGTVAEGMSKKAVLTAIGYPPQIETASIDSDQWTYWSSRFNKFIVYFENGKVIRIQD